jgi:hypothetical protein
LRISNAFVAFAAASFLTGSVSAQVDGVSVAVFGPKTFAKTTEPLHEKINFGLKPLVHGPYRLELQSKDVSDVKVTVNGVEHMDFKHFELEHNQSKTVVLTDINTVRVEMRGALTETLSVSIVGYQYEEASAYSSLDLFPGATGSGDLDWRPKGAVTVVRDQGQCGADWAFSAIGALEGAAVAKGGPLRDLSEQQLIDCGTSFGLLGCNGGNAASAYRYLMSFGSATDASYPYTARDGTCKYPSAITPSARVIGIQRSPAGDDNRLMEMLRSKGPVSVVVNANWLETYAHHAAKNKNYIEDGRKCETHAPMYLSLLLVGAGTDSGVPYWTLKAPFGTSFGAQGYIRLARGKDTCGIADYAIIPLI